MALVPKSSRFDDSIDPESASFTSRLIRASQMQRVGELLRPTAPECSFLIGGGRRRASPVRSPPVGLITRSVHSVSPGTTTVEVGLIGAAASLKSWERDEEEFMSPAMLDSTMQANASSTRSRVQMPLNNSSGRSLLKSRDPSKDITPRPISAKRQSMQAEQAELEEV
jgi:hypothetical protein